MTGKISMIARPHLFPPAPHPLDLSGLAAVILPARFRRPPGSPDARLLPDGSLPVAFRDSPGSPAAVSPIFSLYYSQTHMLDIKKSENPREFSKKTGRRGIGVVKLQRVSKIRKGQGGSSHAPR